MLSDFAERMAGSYSVDEVLPQTARMLAEGMIPRSSPIGCARSFRGGLTPIGHASRSVSQSSSFV